MLALRQRATHVARRAHPVNPLRRRTYASESHSKSDHGHSGPAEESLGPAFYAAIGVIPAAMLVNYLARPGADGEPTRLTKLIGSFSDLGQQWETRNTLHTAAIEQAAHDKHLFYNAGRDNHVELTFPETFQVSSPYNVPAGHSINLDKVVAHYRQQHLNEEDRKAKSLTKEQ